jgi:hypothetical protein
MTGPDERGRLETNLVRSPLWESEGAPSEPAPFVASSLFGPFSCSTRLRQLDYKVLALVLERWWWQQPTADTVPVSITLHELGRVIYGRPPDGEERRLLRAALERLWQVEISMVGFDAPAGKQERRWSKVRVIVEISGPIGDLQDRSVFELPTPQETGRLRGSTFTLRLAPWLAAQVRAGYITYLDFAVMRRLSGLAERLWVYLQAERCNGRGDAWVALGPRMYDILGMHYGRDVDARKALRRAAARIMAEDRRYELVSIERRLSWGILARRIASSERRAVRAQIRASLPASSE